MLPEKIFSLVISCFQKCPEAFRMLSVTDFRKICLLLSVSLTIKANLPEKLLNSSKSHKKAGQGYTGLHSIRTFTSIDDHITVMKLESSNSKDSYNTLSNINTFI